MKRIFALLLVSSLAVSLIAGCATTIKERPSETTVTEASEEASGEDLTGEESKDDTARVKAPEETSGTEIKIIDAVGREIIMEKPAEKIVSGYYITTSMMIALGLEDKLVGIEAKSDSRPIYKLAAPELLELTNVGTAKEFNLEGCISLEPDLVILPMRLAEQAETLSDMGLTTLVVNPENTQLLEETITMIGQATGAEDRAAMLNSYYASALKKLEEIRKEKAERPSVYIAGTGSVLSAATPAMYQNSVIETAGGVNVVDDLTDKRWANLSYEQLIVYNPDILVIIPEADFTKDDVMMDEHLSGISAVKNRQVYEMPDRFEAWDSPVPSGILGCMWLSSIIHEEEYPFEMFAKDAVDFYKQFYDSEIDTAFITK